jgi:hypothetical protein
VQARNKNGIIAFIKEFPFVLMFKKPSEKEVL